MKYKQGDILINNAGNKRKILGLCGNIYFVSAIDDFDFCDSANWTEKAFYKYSYRLEEKEWEPEKGERYYYINAAGEVDYDTFDDEPFDNKVKSFMGVFPTEEKCTERIAEIKKLICTK